MKLFTILTTTLLGSVSLVAANGSQWSCDIAQDGSGLPQQPMCCNSTSRPNNKQGSESVVGADCFQVPLTENKICPGRKPLLCCYSIGPQNVCTSFPKWGNPDDM
ncbi:hypothetical protein DTO166G4_8434 [Paecilomyces variotii]|nr:hypothetical protein DTO166G4_8434 [Paecilomyces variotii]KAJ9229834.1 hypothetical protein DTO166G5_7649 [Paecilomyces variotii]KAJ9248309.1 hypothetical protein DTO207G8_7484 [Paecilomyces variotii]KAJ9253136.1 hypothetical protein DTO195F2_7197 [Paecilomyces variotii]KAJ9307119.1 hypothetical protein DTO217A2_3357 [Paecilomyces variotii]